MSNQVRATMDRAARPVSCALGLVATLTLALAPCARAQDLSPARGDITVDQAVRFALERNKDLLISGENIPAASGIRKQALQSYLPRHQALAEHHPG